MKRYIMVLTFAAVLSSAAAAQTADTSAQRRHRGSQAGQQEQTVKGRRMDRFIDANGDGICDHRERGFGFKRNQSVKTGDRVPQGNGVRGGRGNGGKK